MSLPIKKNINVLHTKKYIVFNFTKYPGQVTLWSHPYLLQVLLPFRTSVVTGFTFIFHVSSATHRVPKLPQEGVTGFRGFQVLPVNLHNHVKKNKNSATCYNSLSESP